MPLLRCLRPSEADYALWEVHEGACGNHLGARSLSHKLLRQGYYWPTMHHDSIEYVKKCDRCQRYANIQRQPATELTPICAPTAILGTGGEPGSDMSKVKGPILLDRMGGEALQRPNVPPQPC